MNYDKLAQTAVRLIAKTGRSVTLQKLDATPEDSNKPWKGPATPTVADSADLIATFVPAGGGGLGLDFIDDELLKRAEQVALIAPSEKDVSEFHAVLDGSSRWKIEWVQVLKPAEKVLLYIVGVKR